MAEFYKILSPRYKWAGIRGMSWGEAKRLPPPRAWFFFKRGKYFSVRRYGDIVVKTTRNKRPLLDINYRENDLTKRVRGQITAQEIENLRASVPGYNDTVLEAYIRAKVEQLSYARLCRSVGPEFMVEQSVILTWGRWGRNSGLNVLLLQPYVQGRTIRSMFPFRYSIFGKPESGLQIRGKFRRLIPIMGPQLRHLIESHHVDVHPRNFIYADDGRLVYVDYQPAFPRSREQGMNDYQMHLRSYYYRFDEMLKRWGY